MFKLGVIFLTEACSAERALPNFPVPATQIMKFWGVLMSARSAEDVLLHEVAFSLMFNILHDYILTIWYKTVQL